jgi:hypothetical protein
MRPWIQRTGYLPADYRRVRCESMIMVEPLSLKPIGVRIPDIEETTMQIL